MTLEVQYDNVDLRYKHKYEYDEYGNVVITEFYREDGTLYHRDEASEPLLIYREQKEN